MIQLLWYLYGWTYWRWHRAFMCRLQFGRYSKAKGWITYAWWTALISWCWNTPPGKCLLDCRFRHWLIYQIDPNRFGCPHCNDCRFNDSDAEELFEKIASGSYGTQDGTIYWWRGYATCPRCGQREIVEDST
jgi:hypothetical protein